jgi:selenocysteine lyase/cysteine desulfurase
MTPEIRALFAPEPGYLNTATTGVPPQAAVAAMHDVVDQWRRGQLAPAQFDEVVHRSRRAWAALTGVPVSSVAIGAAASQLIAPIAAALPDGARVVTAAGEFTSVVFPFLAHADRGVTVETVPLEEITDRREPADLIAVSAVQSADGRVIDLPALLAAGWRSGARVLLDTTQATGWLPLDCAQVDYVVCAAYKWLLAPKGAAFLSVRPELLDEIRPLAAGWYAGDDPWTSIYGPPLRLARDARRFDIAPAWFCWAAAAESLELLAGLNMIDVHRHDVGLADAFLAGLGLPPQGSAIATVDVPGATERLAAAGVRTAVRAGRVRAAFHLYNDLDDVAMAVAALRD